MLLKGKQIVDFLKPTTILLNQRFCTVPHTVSTASEAIPSRKEKKEKESFMKNVFLGKFHSDFLSFSANLKIDSSSRFQELLILFQTFMREKPYEAQNSYECLKFLARNGFFYKTVPQLQSDVCYSELLKFYEDLDLSISLALLLEVQSSLVIPTILNHGTIQHKDTYMKDILEGKITGAYALSEENSGSDPSALKSLAADFNDTFLLNGEKCWVTNALHADFYIVFANIAIDNLLSESEAVKDLSVFLVDRTDTLQIQGQHLLGLNSCELGKIKFTDHSLAKSNLLGQFGDGYKIAGEGLANQKFIILASILSCLKRMISVLTNHVNKQKMFPRDLKDCDLIKKKIANIATTTYCLESMLYFVCDLLDKYTIDINLESVLLQIYGFEKGIHALMECLDLLGAKSYDKSFEYEKLLCDLKGLQLFASKDVRKLYASLIGLDHAGNLLKDIVRKNRNPFNFPGYIFKKMFKDRRFASGNPKLTLKLYMNVHPSLKMSADQLEHCVLLFQYTVELLLSRHGSDIVNRQLELKRFSDIALDIFTMASVLSRASHSYCTGIQYCDDEVLLAKSICYELYSNTKKNIDNIIDSDMKLYDAASLLFGSNILNKRSYFFENPNRSCV